MRRRITVLFAAGFLSLMLAGCAAASPQPAAVNQTAAVHNLPDQNIEYTATGVVIDDGDGAQLCFGVLESFPPQCGGPVNLNGWSWDSLDEATYETAPLEGTTLRWDNYQVYGSYDDGSLTLTRPAEADTRDPATVTAAWTDPAGSRTEAELHVILLDVMSKNPGLLGLSTGDGILLVTTSFDDGTLQHEFDDRYGPHAVAVTSWLQPSTDE